MDGDVFPAAEPR